MNVINAVEHPTPHELVRTFLGLPSPSGPRVAVLHLVLEQLGGRERRPWVGAGGRVLALAGKTDASLGLVFGTRLDRLQLLHVCHVAEVEQLLRLRVLAVPVGANAIHFRPSDSPVHVHSAAAQEYELIDDRRWREVSSAGRRAALGVGVDVQGGSTGFSCPSVAGSGTLRTATRGMVRTRVLRPHRTQFPRSSPPSPLAVTVRQPSFTLGELWQN